MTYPTWSELKTKIEADLDLQDEDFVTASELLGYANEAVDEAEAEIHTLYEDYFLTEGTITLIAGTSSYALPSDIYGSKIRGVIFSNNGLIYPVKRIRNSKKFELIANIRFISSSTDDYRYLLKNASAAAG